MMLFTWIAGSVDELAVARRSSPELTWLLAAPEFVLRILKSSLNLALHSSSYLMTTGAASAVTSAGSADFLTLGSLSGLPLYGPPQPIVRTSRGTTSRSLIASED